MQDRISRDVQNIHNIESLVDFMRDTLNWPIPDEGLEFDDITFNLPPAFLKLDADTQVRIVGCWQLQPFDPEFSLPAVDPKLDANDKARQQLLVKLGVPLWGIFFIQFENNVELDRCRVLLKKVLRGIINNPSLPFRKHDKLLFICTTTDFQNISFACFSGKKGNPIVDDYIPLVHFRLEA